MRRPFAIRIVLLAVAVLALRASRAEGQRTCTGTRPGSCSPTALSVQYAILNGVLLTVDTNNGVTADTVQLATPTDADYAAGLSSMTGPTITVKANKAWTIAVRGNAATWTGVQTAPGVTPRANKPVADLLWSTGGAYTPLTTTDATVGSGTATAGTTITTSLQVLWSWTLDVPARYTLGLTYTLTAP